MGRDTFYNLDEAIENIEGAEYFAPQDVVLLPLPVHEMRKKVLTILGWLETSICYLK